MEIHIVRSNQRFAESHAETLDLVSKERRFLPRLEGFPKAEVLKFIQDIVSKEQSQFFAVHDGTAIGWCDVLRKGLPALSHTGILGMGIRKEYRGLGIGKRLLRATIEDAEQKGIERIELCVFERNQNAISLYSSHGFKVEARMQKFVKLDGVYYSALAMARVK